MPALLRLGAWGGCAVIALILAVVAARSDIGSRRLAVAFAKTDNQLAMGATTQPTEESDQTRRLNETVRALSADRDRLLMRVTVLERNLDDITGSISKTVTPRAAPAAAPPPVAPPAPAAAASAPPAGPTVASTVTTAPLSLPRRGGSAFTSRLPAGPAALDPADPVPDAAATGSTATSSEFAVDIGGGASVDALRDLWAAAKSNHALTLNGLRPLVAVREGAKPGSVELRLIAGPIANAAAAGKICAALASVGWSCKSTMFDGQRLAAR